MRRYCISRSMIFNTLLFILSASIWPCFCRNLSSFCREEERDALIGFRRTLSDPYGSLSSWKGKDCCRWRGVRCNAATGHVVRLELLPRIERSTSISGYDYVFSEPQLYAAKLSPHLLKLKHLRHLDLTGIRVNGAIPHFIGSMNQMRYLNLSGMGFQGIVPSHLGNLTYLEVLDLRAWPYDLLSMSDARWVSRLRALKHLDISGVRVTIPAAGALMQELTMLPSLSHLALSFCGIRNFHISPAGRRLNSSFLANLRYLDLSANSFQGQVPTLFQNLTSLEHLDLSANSFDSLGSHFLSGPNLKHLDISGNSFRGQIPTALQNMTSLTHLDLSDNSFDSLGSHFLSGPNLKHLDISRNSFRGRIPTALQNMTSLTYLDMRDNSFDSLGSHFLSGPNLKHLDISRNSFRGQIPTALQNMTSLTHLDLSDNSFSSIPAWFRNLKHLIHMDISSNPLGHTAGGLSLLLRDKCNLRHLILHNGSFRGQFIGNSTGFCATNLEGLGASDNLFEGKLPDWLGNLEKLIILELSWNSFAGPVPDSLGKLRNLKCLDLSYNFFDGAIPESLGQLSDLRILDFSHSSLDGTVSDVHFMNLSRLTELVLSNNNNLTVKIESAWVPPSQLSYIDMGSCKIDGRFLQWLRTQEHASVIRLSNASISGELPELLGNWSVGGTLHLSHNQITGPLLGNWSVGRTLDLSHNQITGPLLGNWSVGRTLDLSHNQITGPLLGNWSVGGTLDLSHNQITGTLPNTFTFPAELDLSYNQISGQIPANFSGFSSLFLNDNLISGPIPTSFCEFQGSERLLDLSRNKLSGNIPDCWDNPNISLSIINFSSNKLSGLIPSSLGKITSLQSLHLNDNNLQGELPMALKYLASLAFLDLGENSLSGCLPSWIGEDLQLLMALKLRNNQFTGSIPLEFCRLSQLKWLDLASNHILGTIPTCFGYLQGMSDTAYSMSPPSPTVAAYPISALSPAGSNAIALGPTVAFAPTVVDTSPTAGIMKGNELQYITDKIKYVCAMDLSRNNLEGPIPEELASLTGLRSLNLSHNLLSGSIPQNIGDMKVLESLDLASNYLSGHIPPSISYLNFLSHLNLSNNNFSGRPPKGNQLDTLYADHPLMYAGNPLLCGDPLPNRCPGDKVQEPPNSLSKGGDGNESSSSERIVFYGVVATGFATGFWGVIGILVFKKNWRVAFFRFAEEWADSAYVAVTVKVDVLKRRMRST